MKDKIKKLFIWLYDWAWLFAVATLIVGPLVLPAILVFHPLLVVPYYGILWWTASMHYLTCKNISFRSAKCNGRARIKKSKEEK
jgi:hypothetical protein